MAMEGIFLGEAWSYKRHLQMSVMWTQMLLSSVLLIILAHQDISLHMYCSCFLLYSKTQIKHIQCYCGCPLLSSVNDLPISIVQSFTVYRFTQNAQMN